jgi:hypothetical protein
VGSKENSTTSQDQEFPFRFVGSRRCHLACNYLTISWKQGQTYKANPAADEINFRRREKWSMLVVTGLISLAIAPFFQTEQARSPIVNKVIMWRFSADTSLWLETSLMKLGAFYVPKGGKELWLAFLDMRKREKDSRMYKDVPCFECAQPEECR